MFQGGIWACIRCSQPLLEEKLNYQLQCDLYRAPGREGPVLYILEYHCCCCDPGEEQKENGNGRKAL